MLNENSKWIETFDGSTHWGICGRLPRQLHLQSRGRDRQIAHLEVLVHSMATQAKIVQDSLQTLTALESKHQNSPKMEVGEV